MTLLRKLQEGWLPIAMHDPPGRRGLWVRTTTEAEHPAVIELCSGREGDDAEVTIRVGDVMTPERLYLLSEVLSFAQWAYELGIDGGATSAELHQRIRALEPCPTDGYGGAHCWECRDGENEDVCRCGAWRKRLASSLVKP